MEKFKPHHDLAAIKLALCSVAKLQAGGMTGTALKDAIALGMSTEDVLAVVQATEPAHFKKSMTTLQDHKIWQDVYNVPWNQLDITLYVKFSQDPKRDNKEHYVVSFKEV